eukprot:3515425-Prorocentrum_lima.AAC.1
MCIRDRFVNKSPVALRHVREGDTIVSVNGVRLRFQLLESLKELFRSHPLRIYVSPKVKILAAHMVIDSPFIMLNSLPPLRSHGVVCTQK